MTKKYFTYIPFLAGDGAAELESAVVRWQNNFNSVIRVNEEIKRRIGLKKNMLEKAVSEEDFDQIRSLREDIKKLEEELEKAPTLAAGKSPEIIKYQDGKLRILQTMKPEEYVLYIVGHCAPGSETIRENQSFGGSPDKLTATKLLERMKTDGLPTNIINIKLLSCFGATTHFFDEKTQKSFSDLFWKEIRGYCASLVKLTAYSEAVLITSFYAEEKNPQKTFAKIPLGEVLDLKNAKPAGRLRDKKKVYRSCYLCKQPVLTQCCKCSTEFCGEVCFKQHLAEGEICLVGK